MAKLFLFANKSPSWFDVLVKNSINPYTPLIYFGS